MTNVTRPPSDARAVYTIGRIAMFIHSVFFYKQPEASQAAVDQLLADCFSLLAKIPGVEQLRAGPPAMTPRSVVDNTYAIALCVTLTDTAAHDLYQTHALHLEFIARNKATWRHVRIYDFHSQG